jgi:hypothetical protein
MNPTITDRIRSRLMFAPSTNGTSSAQFLDRAGKSAKNDPMEYGDTVHRRHTGCNRVLKFFSASERTDPQKCRIVLLKDG